MKTCIQFKSLVAPKIEQKPMKGLKHYSLYILKTLLDPKEKAFGLMFFDIGVNGRINLDETQIKIEKSFKNETNFATIETVLTKEDFHKPYPKINKNSIYIRQYEDNYLGAYLNEDGTLFYYDITDRSAQSETVEIVKKLKIKVVEPKAIALNPTTIPTTIPVHAQPKIMHHPQNIKPEDLEKVFRSYQDSYPIHDRKNIICLLNKREIRALTIDQLITYINSDNILRYSYSLVRFAQSLPHLKTSFELGEKEIIKIAKVLCYAPTSYTEDSYKKWAEDAQKEMKEKEKNQVRSLF